MRRLIIAASFIFAAMWMAGWIDPSPVVQAAALTSASISPARMGVSTNSGSPLLEVSNEPEDQDALLSQPDAYFQQPILELCDLGRLFHCRAFQRPGFPPAPPGYAWKRLDGLFTFSAYVHPTEADYPGDLVEIPGIQGIKAKEDFLFAVDGIGMQGGGYIRRVEPGIGRLDYYIKYISGHWQLGDRDVIIEDEWYFASDHAPVDPRQIQRIRLNHSKFSIMTDPKLIPFYSIAAPARFPIGAQVFVPALASYGGLFEVQDRGGAFSKDAERFDVFVGTEMEEALNWFRLDQARSNLPVYMLIKNGA